ncbi:hypothetical protein V6N11_077511 [Hibiscus sabdariffa]|uniref:Uncharacterized protein n=1 Tax=Hibiscus sabdariffa TaxID=183260 RepID=A0ABR2TDA2_9ROSI
MNKLGTNARPRTKEFMEALAVDVQVWYNNPVITEWLKEHADVSQLNNLKWMYYLINKCPWSRLDENEAFLTIADSTVKLLPEATKPITEWQGSTCDLYSIPYSQEYHSFLTSASDLLHKAGVEVYRMLVQHGIELIFAILNVNYAPLDEIVHATLYELKTWIEYDNEIEKHQVLDLMLLREFVDPSLVEIKRDYEKEATNVVYGTVRKCFELKSRNEVMQYAKRTSLGSNQNGARQSMEGH